MIPFGLSLTVELFLLGIALVMENLLLSEHSGIESGVEACVMWHCGKGSLPSMRYLT